MTAASSRGHAFLPWGELRTAATFFANDSLFDTLLCIRRRLSPRPPPAATPFYPGAALVSASETPLATPLNTNR